MLRVIRNLRELPFGDLMKVYREGNEENGAELYPHLSVGQQVYQAERDFYQYLQEGFFTHPEDCCCLWEAGGRLVAALRLQAYRDGLLLEALETAPDRRRQGHGKALVQAVLESIPGKKVYVHIANWNKASILLHKKCGFVKLLDHAVYADGSVTDRACTYVLGEKMNVCD